VDTNAGAEVAEFPAEAGEAVAVNAAARAGRAQSGCSLWDKGCSYWHMRRLELVQELAHKPEHGGPCRTCTGYSPHRSVAG
jgi:hypothetical protein